MTREEKFGFSKERFNEIFSYVDGKIYWKIKYSRKVIIGNEAGTLAGPENNKYVQVGLNGRKYKVHRIIYIMHNGFISGIIDHKKGKLNHIENLRECTQLQNTHNRKLNKNSKTGIKGVTWCNTRNKYIAKLANRHLGYFYHKRKAEKEVVKVRNKYHGEFARHS